MFFFNCTIHVYSSIIHNSQRVKATHVHKQMSYVHTMEYSALKRKEILIYTTTWMNLEDIVLSQLQKYRMIPFI